MMSHKIIKSTQFVQIRFFLQSIKVTFNQKDFFINPIKSCTNGNFIIEYSLLATSAEQSSAKEYSFRWVIHLTRYFVLISFEKGTFDSF